MLYEVTSVFTTVLLRRRRNNCKRHAGEQAIPDLHGHDNADSSQNEEPNPRRTCSSGADSTVRAVRQRESNPLAPTEEVTGIFTTSIQEPAWNGQRLPGEHPRTEWSLDHRLTDEGSGLFTTWNGEPRKAAN